MTTALILSGGTGTRFGANIPKQYIEVDNKPILVYCIERLVKCELINNIHIVADEAWHASILNWLNEYELNDKFRGFSLPGANRQLSIYNGLTDIRKYSMDEDYVLIHDAVRPLISQDLIKRSLEAIREHDGVLPVLPMKDTVYLSENGSTISSLLDRQSVYAGQAPETFLLGKYLEANNRLIALVQEKDKTIIDKKSKILGINGSTEPAVLAGMDIAMIPGSEDNFKITTKSDLDRFKECLKNESMEFV